MNLKRLIKIIKHHNDLVTAIIRLGIYLIGIYSLMLCFYIGGTHPGLDENCHWVGIAGVGVLIIAKLVDWFIGWRQSLENGGIHWFEYLARQLTDGK